MAELSFDRDVRETVRDRYAAAARAATAGGACCDAGPEVALTDQSGQVIGALTREEFEQGLTAAGFSDIEITVTHRVHEHAASAIVRATKLAA